MRTEEEIRKYVTALELEMTSPYDTDMITGIEISLNTLKWVLGEIVLPGESK